MSAEAVDYTYDDAGRLISASYNNGATVITYSYDPAGNMLSKVISSDPDTDGDGLPDSVDTDDDGDGIPDDYEIANGLDPLDADDASEDPDLDTVSSLDEYLAGTDPQDPDTDDDTVSDAIDNCPLSPNADQFDYDGDGVGDACSLSQDVTTLSDVTADGVPDSATFTGVYGSNPGITVYSGANGSGFSSIDYINDKWQGIGLGTVRDADQNNTADDPAIAMLVVNKETRKIRVETRRADNGTFLSSVQFLNENWRAIDIAVVDDLNGDGITNDTAIAVLSERISDGRVQLQLRDFGTGTLISNTVYLNARWTPIAMAVADRSAMAPVGTLAPVIGVIAHEPGSGKRVMQVRVAGSGDFDQNIKFLGSTWDYQDVSVNYDANSDGSNDDPVWMVLATRPSDNVIRVQSKFVADGSFDDNIVILNSNWEAFRMDAANDMGGNTSGEIVISAIRRADGVRRIHVKDFASGVTTLNIAP